jgi:hypothetical protein
VPSGAPPVVVTPALTGGTVSSVTKVINRILIIIVTAFVLLIEKCMFSFFSLLFYVNACMCLSTVFKIFQAHHVGNGENAVFGG